MKNRSLHIVHGGVDNGDKLSLEKAAGENLEFKGWIVPKSVKPGDDVVIYISGYGFFATAIVKDFSRPRSNWQNRYSAPLTSIKLIVPSISIGTIRKHIPKLSWINFPRSITTPSLDISNQIRDLITHRKEHGVDIEIINETNIDELRDIAIKTSRPSLPAKTRVAIYRAGSDAIRRYVLLRAKGKCEGCKKPAPFKKLDGNPYLEPHHTKRRADGGPDHPKNVIALCPNCHRRTEYSIDKKDFNKKLIEILSKIESKK